MFSTQPRLRVGGVGGWQVRNGAQVTVELSPEEVQQAWSRGKVGGVGGHYAGRRVSAPMQGLFQTLGLNTLELLVG